jgi:hypothetical protein
MAHLEMCFIAGYRCQMHDFIVQNLVGKCEVGFEIDLYKVYDNPEARRYCKVCSIFHLTARTHVDPTFRLIINPDFSTFPCGWFGLLCFSMIPRSGLGLYFDWCLRVWCCLCMRQAMLWSLEQRWVNLLSSGHACSCFGFWPFLSLCVCVCMLIHQPHLSLRRTWTEPSNTSARFSGMPGGKCSQSLMFLWPVLFLLVIETTWKHIQCCCFVLLSFCPFVLLWWQFVDQILCVCVCLFSSACYSSYQPFLAQGVIDWVVTLSLCHFVTLSLFPLEKSKDTTLSKRAVGHLLPLRALNRPQECAAVMWNLSHCQHRKYMFSCARSSHVF